MKHQGATGVLTWLKMFHMKMSSSFFDTSELKLEQLIQFRFHLLNQLELI